jgi:O-antigen ligase
VACAALSVAAASGLLTLSFARYSDLRWAVSLAAPLTALVVLLSRRPLTVLAVLAALVVPFADFTVTVGGVRVTPLVALLGSAALVAAASTARAHRAGGSSGQTPLDLAGPWLPALLLPALAVGSATVRYLAVLVTAGVLAVVARRALRADRAALPLLAGALVLAATGQAVLALIEFRTGHPLDLYGQGGTSYRADYFFSFDQVWRPTAAFRDPIALGNVLAVSIPLAVGLVAGPGLPWSARAGLLGAALTGVAGLAVTFSRMSWVGAAAGVVVTALLLPGARRWAALLCGAAGVLAAGLAAAAMAGPALLERLASITDPLAPTVRTAAFDVYRQSLWQAAWEVARAHFPFGVGAGRLPGYLAQRLAGQAASSHAHSTYLQALAEAGLPGATVIVTLAGAALATTRRAVRRAPVPGLRTADRTVLGRRCLLAGAAGAMVAVGIVWTTDFTVQATPVACTVTLAAVLLSGAADRTEHPGA